MGRVDWLTKNMPEIKRGSFLRHTVTAIDGDSMTITFGSADREALFRDEWAQMIGLWRVWTTASDAKIKSHARALLYAKLQAYGLGKPERLLVLADSDRPDLLLDALAPKCLLLPPPDPRFGPAVTAVTPADLHPLIARYRADAKARGDVVAGGYLDVTGAPHDVLFVRNGTSEQTLVDARTGYVLGEVTLD